MGEPGPPGEKGEPGRLGGAEGGNETIIVSSFQSTVFPRISALPLLSTLPRLSAPVECEVRNKRPPSNKRPLPSPPENIFINNSSTVSIRLMLLQFYYNLHVSPSNILLSAPPRISALPRLSAPLKTQI